MRGYYGSSKSRTGRGRNEDYSQALALTHASPSLSACARECVYMCVCAELRSARTDGGGEGVSRFCLNMKFDPPRAPYTHNLSHTLLLNFTVNTDYCSRQR